MANRTFKSFAIQAGGTPQPLVGTWITATTSPAGVDFSGEGLTKLPVNDSSMFQQGDRVLLQSVTFTNIQLVHVQSIPDSTHINVHSITTTRTGGAYGTGDFVSLAIPINGVFVQSVPGDAGLLYIGTVGMNKTGLVKVIATLQNFAAGTQPVYFSDARYYTADPMRSSDLWIDGTTADTYLPSFPVA
jgi:hypothetical protein